MLFIWKLLLVTYLFILRTSAIEVYDHRVDRGVFDIQFGDIKIYPGATWSLIDRAISAFVGELQVERDAGFYITLTNPWIGLEVGFTSLHKSIVNHGVIAFNSVVSLVKSSYDLAGYSFTNHGEMYFGASGSLSGKMGITAEHWTNNGLIVFYQNQRSSGSVKLGRALGSITNNGQICFFHQVFSPNTDIVGNGCITAQEASTIYIPSAAQSFDAMQSIYLADSKSSIIVKAISTPQTFDVYGFGNGNKIGLTVPLVGLPLVGSAFSYSTKTGILTLRSTALTQHFNIGPGYDPHRFKIVTDSGEGLPSTINGSVQYDGPVPKRMIPKNCRAECKPLPQAPGTEPTRFLTTVVLTAHDEPDTRSGIVDITTNTKGEWYTTTSLYPKMTTKENTKPAATAVNQQQQQTATTTKIQPDSQVDIGIVVEPEETELVYPLVENPFSGSLMVMISSTDEPTDTNFETSVPTVAEPVPESNIETNIYQSNVDESNALDSSDIQSDMFSSSGINNPATVSTTEKNFGLQSLGSSNVYKSSAVDYEYSSSVGIMESSIDAEESQVINSESSIAEASNLENGPLSFIAPSEAIIISSVESQYSESQYHQAQPSAALESTKPDTFEPANLEFSHRPGSPFGEPGFPFQQGEVMKYTTTWEVTNMAGEVTTESGVVSKSGNIESTITTFPPVHQTQYTKTWEVVNSAGLVVTESGIVNESGSQIDTITTFPPELQTQYTTTWGVINSDGSESSESGIVVQLGNSYTTITTFPPQLQTQYTTTWEVTNSERSIWSESGIVSQSGNSVSTVTTFPQELKTQYTSTWEVTNSDGSVSSQSGVVSQSGNHVTTVSTFPPLFQTKFTTTWEVTNSDGVIWSESGIVSQFGNSMSIITTFPHEHKIVSPTVSQLIMSDADNKPSESGGVSKPCESDTENQPCNSGVSSETCETISSSEDCKTISSSEDCESISINSSLLTKCTDDWDGASESSILCDSDIISDTCSETDTITQPCHQTQYISTWEVTKSDGFISSLSGIISESGSFVTTITTFPPQFDITLGMIPETIKTDGYTTSELFDVSESEAAVQSGVISQLSIVYESNIVGNLDSSCESEVVGYSSTPCNTDIVSQSDFACQSDPASQSDPACESDSTASRPCESDSAVSKPCDSDSSINEATLNIQTQYTTTWEITNSDGSISTESGIVSQSGIYLSTITTFPPEHQIQYTKTWEVTDIHGSVFQESGIVSESGKSFTTITTFPRQETDEEMSSTEYTTTFVTTNLEGENFTATGVIIVATDEENSWYSKTYILPTACEAQNCILSEVVVSTDGDEHTKGITEIDCSSETDDPTCSYFVLTTFETHSVYGPLTSGEPGVSTLGNIANILKTTLIEWVISILILIM